MSMLARIVTRPLPYIARVKIPSQVSVAWKTSGSAQQQIDEFITRNQKANRPMSPHLTIYKPQLTSMLSITHRGTGIALTGLTSCFAFGTLLGPEAANSLMLFLASLKGTTFGSLVLYELKFALAWPIIFHACNGVRHLMWDRSKGLDIKSVYTSGWLVFGSSIVLAALFPLLFQM